MCTDDIKGVLVRELRYMKPNLINAQLILNIEKDEDRDDEVEKQQDCVYVFPTFMKPGR